MSMARAMGALVTALAALMVAACADSGTTTTASTGSSSGGASSTASTGGLGNCNPACTPPQFCSVASQCIDQGTCLGDADCPMGEVCDTAAKTCKPGGGCGQQTATAMAVPPNLLIVLDRSCSMTKAINGKSKWQIAVEALNQLTTSYAGKIRFGLTMFPDLTGASCSQDAIPFDPAPGNEAAIQGVLTSSLMNMDPNYPKGPCVTNIDTAMGQAAGETAFTDTTRKSYALLLTDGKQSSNCSLGGGDAGTVTTITNMLAAGVPTFVIGFGSAADPTSLSDFANAGGVPNTGPAYYDASDQMSLEAALDKIASSTIGCDLVLDMPPPDMEQIYVFFGTTPVDADATNGWTYDPATNTVTFHGTSCDGLKAGTVSDVQVIFGCTPPNPN